MHANTPLVQQLLPPLLSARTTLDVRAALDALVTGGWVSHVALYRLQAEPRLLVAVGELPDGAPRALQPGRGACWEALETGVPVHFVDADTSHTAYPLVVGDALLGVFATSSADAGEQIASWVALALERARDADRVRMRAGILDQIVPLISDGLLSVAADGQVLEYSPSLQALTGWTREQVQENGWTNLVYSDPLDRAQVQEGIAALVRGLPSQGTRRTLARSDGGSRRAAIWNRLVPSPSGDSPAFLAIFRDVTESEAEQRRQLRDDALMQLGVLARGVAHDFNNLLCSVMGHADLIALHSADERVQRHAATLIAAAEHGSALARQLLAFGGSTNTRLRPRPLRDVVEQACRIFRGQLPVGVTLACAPELSSVLVEVDEGQLQHALLNLLTNALHAVGANGVIVVDGQEAPLPDDLTYRAPGCEAGRWARLSVSDSGTGFPVGDLTRLFEPYFSTRQGGHGVGLAAVRGVVGNHGGGVRLRSDGGAVVELYLPVSDRPELAIQQLDVGAPVSASRLWVLDDHEQILEFSRIALMAEGHQVRTFRSVDELLKAAGTEEPPMVVVLDVRGPEGGGPRALQGLHELGIEPQVLWVSGQLPDASPVGEHDTFLQKPYTGRELVRVVNNVLRATATPTR